MQKAGEYMQWLRISGRPIFCQAIFAAARRHAALLIAVCANAQANV